MKITIMDGLDYIYLMLAGIFVALVLSEQPHDEDDRLTDQADSKDQNQGGSHE